MHCTRRRSLSFVTVFHKLVTHRCTAAAARARRFTTTVVSFGAYYYTCNTYARPRRRSDRCLFLDAQHFHGRRRRSCSSWRGDEEGIDAERAKTQLYNDDGWPRGDEPCHSNITATIFTWRDAPTWFRTDTGVFYCPWPILRQRTLSYPVASIVSGISRHGRLPQDLGSSVIDTIVCLVWIRIPPNTFDDYRCCVCCTYISAILPAYVHVVHEWEMFWWFKWNQNNIAFFGRNDRLNGSAWLNVLHNIILV